MGNQRAAFELPAVEVPSPAGLIAILEKGGKELQLVMDCMAETVRLAAASIISDDEKITGADNFPFSKITWEAIANQDKRERTKIDDATWELFAKDYLEIMPALTGKDADQLGNAIQVYMKKFAIVKTNKKVLEKLKDQLTIYVDNTKVGDQVSDILELLQSKLDVYLNSNEVELLIANL